MYFKKLQYHVSLNNGDPMVVFNHFTDNLVLDQMVSKWNGMQKEWKYWVTEEDRAHNAVAVAGDLPYLCGGFCRPTPNGFVFNAEPSPSYSGGDSFDRTKPPGIID